jgi:predicted MFS family arabinose efflux permease
MKKTSADRTTGPRPALLSRALLLLFAANFGAVASFYLLLSPVPQYATALGANGIGAGLVTGVLMLATVAAELVTPRLMTRLGCRPVLAAGLFLLGAPALALIGPASMASILAVCAVRGVGFAIVMVAGGALMASVVPAERRGEALGVSGVVVGIPAVVFLPLGAWLTGHVGYEPVFVAGAVASLAAMVVVPGLPGREPEAEEPVGVLDGLRTAALVRPSVVFMATAMAAGIVVTFLPVAVGPAAAGAAPLALLAQALTATVFRWAAGRYGDRHGPARLLAPAVVAVAAGVLVLAFTSSPAAVVLGMALFGAGFGVAQNASLSLLFSRVSRSGHGAVSALWNGAYDGGLGLGATGFGVLAAAIGYRAAFALTVVVVLAALVPVWADRSRSPIAAMPRSIALSLRFPKPRTSSGGCVAPVER